MLITAKDLDLKAYAEKFRLADAILKQPHPNPETYKELLNDPTTFSYMFFRDRNGERLKLYPYQDAILNDRNRFIYFRASNQIGKSLGFQVKAGRNLIVDHGHAHTEAIVTKSLPQAHDQMRNTKYLLKTMRGIDWNDAGSTDSMSVITVDINGKDGKLKYTNTLVCAPCTEGLLGYALDELNLDEFEFWEVDLKYFFNQIAQPRTYSTKGRIMVMSNPNGAENFGAELERQKDLDGNDKWHIYVFNFLNKPGNTQREYDQLKKELSRQVFESTVAAIRSISDRNYFTPDEIERSYDPGLNELKMIGKQPFFALDVGAKHDQSVLVGGYVEYETQSKEDYDNGHKPHINVQICIIHCYPVGYPIARVVGVPVPELDGWHHVKSVKEFLMEWSADGTMPIFGVDCTGNSGIVPLFETAGIYPVDITMSGPVKSGMYQRFKWLMEKGLIHRVRSQEFEYQASHLIMKKSERGYMKIHHETEDDLDDTMDSTAMLIHLMDSADIVEPSLRVF